MEETTVGGGVGAWWWKIQGFVGKTALEISKSIEQPIKSRGV
jgi:hypothetical protein